MAELEPDSLRDRRLLVVEDDYAIASDLEEALEAHGAHVIGPAGTVADALELIAAQAEIDGAVLDIDLHGERAYPVADALRGRGVPFIFATGTTPRSSPPPTRRCRVARNRWTREQWHAC